MNGSNDLRRHGVPVGAAISIAATLAIAVESGGCTLLVSTDGLTGDDFDPGPGSGVDATAHASNDAGRASTDAHQDAPTTTSDAAVALDAPDSTVDDVGADATTPPPDAGDGETGPPVCDGVNDATIPPGTNEVQNSTFESGISGWDPNNAALSQAAGGHCGSYAVLVAANAGPDGYSLDDQGASVASSPIGATYHGQAWFRSTVSGQTVQLVVRERSTSNVVVNARSPVLSLTTAWQRLTIDLTTTYDGSAVDIYAVGGGAAQLLADDVTLVRTQ